MKLVEAFETISEAFPDAYIECVDCIWSDYWEGEIQYNEDNNVLDLECCGGQTYAGDIVGRPHVVGNHTIVNLDLGTGEAVTFLFDNDKKVEFD